MVRPDVYILYMCQYNHDMYIYIYKHIHIHVFTSVGPFGQHVLETWPALYSSTLVTWSLKKAARARALNPRHSNGLLGPPLGVPRREGTARVFTQCLEDIQKEICIRICIGIVTI